MSQDTKKALLVLQQLVYTLPLEPAERLGEALDTLVNALGVEAKDYQLELIDMLA